MLQIEINNRGNMSGLQSFCVWQSENMYANNRDSVNIGIIALCNCKLRAESISDMVAAIQLKLLQICGGVA